MLSIEFRKLLEALSQAGAEFIVVGGCAAVLQDVPISTFDLDIVHKRTPENIERLLSVLATLDAHFYPDFARRKLPPRASDLAGRGHILLSTKLGRLDVLCELTGERGYAELLPHTTEISADALHLRVLDLPTLARVKTEAGRPKDLLAVPIIIAAYEERKKRG
jgi:hypothetical protein